MMASEVINPVSSFLGSSTTSPQVEVESWLSFFPEGNLNLHMALHTDAVFVDCLGETLGKLDYSNIQALPYSVFCLMLN